MLDDPKTLEEIASINMLAFSGNNAGDNDTRFAKMQIRSNLSSPDYRYYIAFREKEVVGYIGWKVLGGFAREHPVIELDQIAISEKARGNRIAPRLIEETVQDAVFALTATNPRFQHDSPVHLVVWTYANNDSANKIYDYYFTDGINGSRNQYGNDEVMKSRTLEAPYSLKKPHE